MRPAGKARRARIPGVFERGATQPDGMQRRPNAAGLSPRAAGVHRADMSPQRVNQPRRHRDTEILGVFVSLWLILSVLSELRVDYSDEILEACVCPGRNGASNVTRRSWHIACLRMWTNGSIEDDCRRRALGQRPGSAPYRDRG